jgi:ubiquinol-cytochrome c reductase iron-sulfur subunit
MARRAWRALVVLVVWRLGGLRRSGSRASVEADPRQRTTGASARAESLVLALLAATAAAAVGFVALFALDPDTQLLGLTLGVMLAVLAAALVICARSVVPQETKIERRPGLADADAVKQVERDVRDGLQGITRRRLLIGAAGAAGAGVAAAVAIPVAALGPGLEGQLRHTPWHAGRALVDDEGAPIVAAAVNEGSFITAFPRHADKDNLGSPVIVVRVDPGSLRLPPQRAAWAPDGLLAYSKICTHAACAISLYRSPLSPSTQARGPALVCPCHYSTFDVLNGGGVEFGPAGRPLPQLPLSVDAAGVVRAAGPMSGPVGPSWWGDRS